MKIKKIVIYLFGIIAVIFTIITIINIIKLISEGHNIVWWSIVFMWPLDLYHFFNFVFLNPSTFFLNVSILGYLRIIVAIVSPFLAMAVAGQFGYSRALWFILTLIFPFILFLVAIHPPKARITKDEKKRLIASTLKIFMIPSILLIVSLLQSNGGTVYLVGARWINSDNVFGQIFTGFAILLGIISIPFGILVALGIIKPDKF